MNPAPPPGNTLNPCQTPGCHTMTVWPRCGQCRRDEAVKAAKTLPPLPQLHEDHR